MAKIHELRDLFLQVQNGLVTRKNNIVSELNKKGMPVTSSNSWDELNTAIGNIQTKTPMEEITKLNVIGSVSTPYVKTITLTNPIIDYKAVTGIREFIPGSQDATLICDFNNADSTNFQDTNGKVVFDGTMYLPKVTITGEMANEGVLGEGELWSFNIDKSLFNTLDEIVYIDGEIPQIKLNGTNPPYIVKALNDIDVTGIKGLNSIIFNSTAINNGKMLLAMSVDGGLTYHGYNSITKVWDIIDVNNFTDFKSKGMSKSVTDILTSAELDSLRDGSVKLRFAYYLETPSFTSTASTDSISIGVQVTGGYQQANKNDYDVIINPDIKTVDFKFYKNGTFTINYMDNK